MPASSQVTRASRILQAVVIITVAGTSTYYLWVLRFQSAEPSEPKDNLVPPLPKDCKLSTDMGLIVARYAYVTEQSALVMLELPRALVAGRSIIGLSCHGQAMQFTESFDTHWALNQQTASFSHTMGTGHCISSGSRVVVLRHGNSACSLRSNVNVHEHRKHLAVCVAPFFGSPPFFHEWLEYHIGSGMIDHAFIYMFGQTTGSVQSLLQKYSKHLTIVSWDQYLTSGTVEPFRPSQQQIPYYSQYLAYDDCLIRAKLSRFEWTTVSDTDMFLRKQTKEPLIRLLRDSGACHVRLFLADHSKDCKERSLPGDHINSFNLSKYSKLHRRDEGKFFAQTNNIPAMGVHTAILATKDCPVVQIPPSIMHAMHLSDTKRLMSNIPCTDLMDEKDFLHLDFVITVVSTWRERKWWHRLIQRWKQAFTKFLPRHTAEVVVVVGKRSRWVGVDTIIPNVVELDVTDSYTGLCDKMHATRQFVIDNYNFHYHIKVDSDVFVNMPWFQQWIREEHLFDTRLRLDIYAGRPQENIRVNKAGKNSDVEFNKLADFYKPYAAGPFYLGSSSLIRNVLHEERTARAKNAVLPLAEDTRMGELVSRLPHTLFIKNVPVWALQLDGVWEWVAKPDDENFITYTAQVAPKTPNHHVYLMTIACFIITLLIFVAFKMMSQKRSN